VELTEDYTAAGFGVRLGAGHSPALLVVDVCRAYLEPSSPLYAGVEDACASVGRLVDAARTAGVPVVWTRVRYDADARLVFHRKVPSLSVFATELGDFPAGVAPTPGERVVVKDHASAFFGTSLADDLRAAGVDTVLVTGFSTSGCVRASALDALQHDFVPLVVREACGDRDPRPHEAALFDLDQKYADVVSEADALAVLAGQTGSGSTAATTSAGAST
jgi:maleamate amidohydrolase